jgi:hypothetical protein
MFSSAECRHRADTLAGSLLMQQPRPLPQFLLVSVLCLVALPATVFSAIKKKLGLRPILPGKKRHSRRWGDGK